MKNLRKISLALSLMMLSSFTGCSILDSVKRTDVEEEEEAVIISPESIVKDWQHPYEEKLKSFMAGGDYSASDKNASMFDITDITGDGIPELIISPNTASETQCEVFTIMGNSVTSLGTYGGGGTFRFLPNKNLIHMESTGTGFTVGKYLAFDDGENIFVPYVSYYDNTASAAQGAKIVHEINNEQYTLPEFDAALEEYRNSPVAELGRKYTFGEDSINYSVKYSEIWGEVLNDEQKESVKNTLVSALDEAAVTNTNPAFELCDLNDDNIPELIISEGNFDIASCRVFYFSGNELIQLQGNYGEGGKLYMDLHEHIFYSKGVSGITYWSLMEKQFVAEEYVSSGNIMEFGRKYILSRENIFKVLNLKDEETETDTSFEDDSAVVSEEETNGEI